MPIPPNPTKGIVYYTDNRLNEEISQKVQSYLKAAGLPIVSCSLKPMNFGKNICLPLKRGDLTMFQQILTGLETIDTDIVFLAEHDVLYHSSHFLFTPPQNDVYYYNTNVWQLRFSDGHAAYYYEKKLSQLCAYRDLLIDHYRKRIDLVKKVGFSRRMGYEPGVHHRPERVDDFRAGTWRSEFPNLDIKHGRNHTEVRWNLSGFKARRIVARTWKETDEIEGWGRGKDIFQ